MNMAWSGLLAVLAIFQSTPASYYYRDVPLSEALFLEAAGSLRHRAVSQPLPPAKPNFFVAANGFTPHGEPLIHLATSMPYEPPDDSLFIVDGVTHRVEPQVVADVETSITSIATQLYQSPVVIVTDWRLRSVGRHTFEMRVPAASPLLNFYYSSGEYYTDVNPAGNLYGACVDEATIQVIFQIVYLDVKPPERGQIFAGGILWGEARAIPSQTWQSQISGLWRGTYRMSASTASWLDVRARQVEARNLGEQFVTALRAPDMPQAFLDIVYGELGDPAQFYPRCPDF